MELLSFFHLMPPGYWILMIALAIPSFLATMLVKAKFAKYSKVATSSGMSGAQAARAVLSAAGLSGVTIERHRGFLSDHYDPRSKTLRLSPDVHDGRSVSSVAVAAHEAGHAIQDAKEYLPLKLRSQLVPAASLGSRLWFLPFMLGVFTGLSGMIYISIGLFGATVLFQLVTLPTEFDASRRAKLELATAGIVRPGEEQQGVATVLNAAAMTYVAAALSAILQLLYLIAMATGGSRD
ncbi:MAG: zinc metallopeptidase [Planctomycetota bacterium]